MKQKTLKYDEKINKHPKADRTSVENQGLCLRAPKSRPGGVLEGSGTRFGRHLERLDHGFAFVVGRGCILPAKRGQYGLSGGFKMEHKIA